MANMNIRTPEFYTDRIRYLRGRGGGVASIITGTNLLDFQSGSVENLHNGKPLDLCSFDTGDNTAKHILFNYNFGSSGFATTFVTILNHNLHSCNGKFRIFVGSLADEVNDVNGASAPENSFSEGTDDDGNPEGVNYTVSEVLNADSDELVKSSNGKSIHVHPASDGTTIIKIVKTSDSSDFTGFRFMGIQFEGDSSSSNTSSSGNFNTTDLTIGGIEIGEIYTMPVAPNLSVKRSIIYDQVRIQQSLGGQKYAIMPFSGKTSTTTTKSPFSTASFQQYAHGGRIYYNMSFSLLQSTDLMPNEYNDIEFFEDSFVGDVWNITEGSFHPFVFSVDSTSTGSNAESEFIYARFDQDSLEMTQTAPDIFNVSLRIEEEF